MKKYYDEKSGKDYIAETEESGTPHGKRNRSKENDFFGRALMLVNIKGNFLFYTLIHIVGTFFAEAAVCLLFSTRKDTVLISGIAGALLTGTVCAVVRDKMKVIYAAAANIVLFLIWTMYFFVFVSGLSAVLFGVQL